MATKLLFTVLLVTSITHRVICDTTHEISEPKFGHSLIKDFAFDPDYIYLDSGALGACPLVVRKVVHEFQARDERKPMLWYCESMEMIAKARRMLGELMNCNEDDIVIIPNTTSGLNAVLRNLKFTNGDRILYLSTIYASTRGVVNYVLDEHKGLLTPLVLNISYPISNEEFMERFETFVNETHDPERPVRIAVIDHTSSKPTIINPIDKMVSILKRFGIPVLIDAAHAIGQVKVDLRALDPDYYVSDLHKWAMTPRPTAVLYVKRENQGHIHPAIVSEFYRNPSNFQKEFWWTGTWDHSKYAAIPAALEYRRSIGGEERIMEYNHKLAVEGGNVMAKILGTRLLQDRDQIASTVDVELPVKNPNNPKLTANWWMKLQLTKYPNTFVPMYMHNGCWWARVSAQVFNEISDFEKLAQHLLLVCDEANKLDE